MATRAVSTGGAVGSAPNPSPYPRLADGAAPRQPRRRLAGRATTSSAPSPSPYPPLGGRAAVMPMPVGRVRRVPFALFSVIVVAALVLLMTSAQALVAQGAFRISDLQRQTETLSVETDLLRLRVARLASPERVADAGREAGLVLPERVEVLDSR